MRSFRNPMIISLGVHAVVILALFFWGLHPKTEERLLTLDVMPTPDIKSPDPRETSRQTVVTPPRGMTVLDVDSSQITPPQDSVSLMFQQPQAFSLTEKKRPASDSSRLDFPSGPTLLSSDAPAFDAEQITGIPAQKSLSGQGPTLPVGSAIIGGLYNLLKKKPAKKPVFDFRLNTSQVQTLALLMDQKHGTQIDLYPHLSQAREITAEMYDMQLETLWMKGFVTREKISPENLFLMFGLPIEMSTKNRKNPIYIYRPNVSKERLHNYLESRLFQMENRLESADADTAALNREIKRVKTQMELMQGLSQ